MIIASEPGAQYRAFKTEIDAAIQRVLDSGWYILGKEVEAFEKEFAEYVGVHHCVSLANGTDAITYALKGFGVGEGDEVITVSHTAVATVAGIELSGATPVLVDIREKDYTIDPAEVEKAITPKTKAIVAVHLYGHPCRVEDLLELCKKHTLFLIEDCAQAHGASYKNQKIGSFGDAACFSFYPTKNLGAIGDGGAVVTRLRTQADKIRHLAQYGWKERYISHYSGGNSRLDELQAAILRVKLNHLNELSERRRAIAARYCERLKDTSLVMPEVVEDSIHAYHLFVCKSKKRDQLMKYLRENGVGATLHYPQAVHQQPAYVNQIDAKTMDVTEQVLPEIISLPMFPELTDEQVDFICDQILQFEKENQLEAVQ